MEPVDKSDISQFLDNFDCSHLNCRYRACFEQGIPSLSGNYSTRIHSETRTWHDKNIKIIIFGAFLTLYSQIVNKKKNIMIRDKKPTDGLDDTLLITKKEYAINFTEQQKKLCLSLPYNGENSYIFVHGAWKIYKFKAKDSEINGSPLCLGNVLKDFSTDNLKKPELYGYVCDFSVDYNSIAVDDILDIHKYLMKRHDIKCCLD